MAKIVLIEPTELYNILNQETVYPCLSDPNFLLLLDSREKTEYDESHILTSKRAQIDEDDDFIVPYDAELECKIHVIVYDGNTRSLREKTPAIVCAATMAKSGSKNPVKVLRGGYEDFSAMYPFLRTQKVLYMPQELDAIETFPCEVLLGLLYIGSIKHARSTLINKELKIKAHINLTDEDDWFFDDSDSAHYLKIPIDDNTSESFQQYMEKIVAFIDQNREENNTIMVWSRNGISRSAAACILYLMTYYKWPLQDAWRHMRSCKFTIRPNRGLVKQLADFEQTHLGKQITNIQDPFF